MRRFPKHRRVKRYDEACLMFWMALLMLALLVTLMGCASSEPTTPEQEYRQTVQRKAQEACTFHYLKGPKCTVRHSIELCGSVREACRRYGIETAMTHCKDSPLC